MKKFPNHPKKLLSLLYEKYNRLQRKEIERMDWLHWSRNFNRYCSELSFDIPEYRTALNYLFIVWNIMNNIQIEEKTEYLPELNEITKICQKEINNLYEKSNPID
jgi:hypothetical protein